LVAQLSEALKARPEELPERVNDMIQRLRTAEKQLEALRAQQLLSAGAELAGSARDVFGVALVAHRADGAGPGDVRRLALDIRSRLAGDRPGVVAVAGSANGKPAVVVAVNETARSLGLTARSLIEVAAAALGGSGGGKDDVAQGGGTDLSAIDDALRRVEQAVSQQVTGS
jgi:alanyl-tRNA synthetase